MRRVVRVIESISEWTGKLTSWLCVALVMVLCYEVMLRNVFNVPTMWAYDTSIMLGVTIIAMGLAYAHLHHRHVRVDVIYNLLSPRGRAMVDVVFALLVFFPAVIVFTYTAADRMWFSWSINEVLTAGRWYPPATPVRAVFFLGLFLLTLQGVAQFTRDLYFLVRNKPYA